MEDPLCDWEIVPPLNQTQMMAESVKADVESSLFQNFTTYEVINHKEATENDRQYCLLRVKIGEKSFVHLKVLTPKDKGMPTLISAETKGEDEKLE